MKNSKIPKIIVQIIFLSICVFMALVANILVGNPVSKAVAKGKIQQYINMVYPTDSKIEKTYYSFPGAGYFSEVKIGNRTLSMKYSFNQIRDENVTKYFQNKFNDDYSMACEALADEYLEFPEWIYIYTSVIADGNYSSDFDKLHVQQKIYLMGISNYDKTITESVSNQMAAKISAQFLDTLGNQYNFRSIQMFYIDKFGGYEIIIDNHALTFDELLKRTKKLDINSIGEEERAFIEGLTNNY